MDRSMQHYIEFKEVQMTCRLIVFILCKDYLTEEVVEGLDFQRAGKEFRTVKYEDELMLLVKEKSVLLGIIYNSTKTETELCFEIDMNMERI
jgi:hypothetical protein